MANLYSIGYGINYGEVVNQISASISTQFPNMGYEFHLILNENKPYGYVTHIGYIIPIVFSKPNTPLGQMDIHKSIELLSYSIIEDKVSSVRNNNGTIDERIIVDKIKEANDKYVQIFSNQIKIHEAMISFEKYCLDKYSEITYTESTNSIISVRYGLTLPGNCIETEAERNIILLKKLIQKYGCSIEEADVDAMVNNISSSKLKDVLTNDGRIYSPYGEEFYEWNNYVAELNNIPYSGSLFQQITPNTVAAFGNQLPKNFVSQYKTPEEEEAISTYVVNYFSHHNAIYNMLIA